MTRDLTKAGQHAIHVVLVVAVCLGLAAAAEACPTCKDTLAHSGDGASVARGYAWSIMFMMSMPFLILSGLGSYFYYEVRRARLMNPTAEMPHAVAQPVSHSTVTN